MAQHVGLPVPASRRAVPRRVIISDDDDDDDSTDDDCRVDGSKQRCARTAVASDSEWESGDEGCSSRLDQVTKELGALDLGGMDDEDDDDDGREAAETLPWPNTQYQSGCSDDDGDASDRLALTSDDDHSDDDDGDSDDDATDADTGDLADVIARTEAAPRTVVSADDRRVTAVINSDSYDSDSDDSDSDDEGENDDPSENKDDADDARHPAMFVPSLVAERPNAVQMQQRKAKQRAAREEPRDPVKALQRRFNQLVMRARQYEAWRQWGNAARMYQQAIELQMPQAPVDALQRKQEKLQQQAQQEASALDAAADTCVDETGDWRYDPVSGNVVLSDGLEMPRELYDKLFPYQRTGVEWIYRLYRNCAGGILGDDMGLGKTLQTIAAVTAMVFSGKIRRVLVFCPVSVMPSWQSELQRWNPALDVVLFHGGKRSQREALLHPLQRRSAVAVVLTTYHMVLSCRDELAAVPWDYLVLDEAHKIKNPSTQIHKAIRTIESGNRLLLTGTPVQNHLRELWALLDFACKGELLGTQATFRREFQEPITRARERDASSAAKQLGAELSRRLTAMIEPHLLRRDKASVMKSAEVPAQKQDQHTGDEAAAGASGQGEEGAAPPPCKDDLILWLPLTPAQLAIYRAFLESDRVKAALNRSNSPLAALSVLKKICDSPRLVHFDGIEETIDLPTAPDVAQLIDESCKLFAVDKLLELTQREASRVLIFSQSKVMLNHIELLLLHRSMTWVRIDGDVAAQDRQGHIDRFNAPDSTINVFLLTTQSGGEGITLTAANRVIIVDPSWNPSADRQAIDRAYRYGQTRDVVAYRLITCGSVEEKIYRKQVFKGDLIQTTIDQRTPETRYFSASDLAALFRLGVLETSETQVQLATQHAPAVARRLAARSGLAQHVALLHSVFHGAASITHHDLLFEPTAAADTAEGSAGNCTGDVDVTAVAPAAGTAAAAAAAATADARCADVIVRAGDAEARLVAETPVRHAVRSRTKSFFTSPDTSRRRMAAVHAQTCRVAETTSRPVLRCRCQASESTLDAYADLLKRAAAARQRADGARAELRALMVSLDLCDSDDRVHQRVIHLAHQLGLWREGIDARQRTAQAS